MLHPTVEYVRLELVKVLVQTGVPDDQIRDRVAFLSGVVTDHLRLADRPEPNLPPETSIVGMRRPA